MRELASTFLYNGTKKEALTAINQLKLNIEKYLQIKPLPLIDGNPDKIDPQTKRMFQYDMISQVGVVIFLFGNQYYDGVLCDSRGVWHDFERAKEQHKFIIPVGATGFAALAIQKELEKNRSLYSYLDNYWDILGIETDPDKLSDTILEILDNLRG